MVVEHRSRTAHKDIEPFSQMTESHVKIRCGLSAYRDIVHYLKGGRVLYLWLILLPYWTDCPTHASFRSYSTSQKFLKIFCDRWNSISKVLYSQLLCRDPKKLLNFWQFATHKVYPKLGFFRIFVPILYIITCLTLLLIETECTICTFQVLELRTPSQECSLKFTQWHKMK